MKNNIEKNQITRKSFLRVATATIMAALFILPVTMNAQGSKPNFSGTWAFNESKSNLGEMGNFGRASKMTVTMEGNNLSVDRVRANQDGQETTTTEKYTLDGKESVNTAGGRGPSKTIVTWSPDGKSLNFAVTRSFERDGQTTEFKSSQVWSLTDAKTLSVLNVFVMQDQESKTTMVYDKK